MRPARYAYGHGGLVKDATHAWVNGFYTGSIEGDPFKAEVEALKLGLILMWDVNMRSAVCEVDCIELVQALVDERYQFHAMASDLLDIRLLLDRDWDVELMHISRDANEVADYLAGLGSGLQCTYTCLEAPPPQLCPILVMDLGCERRVRV